MQEDWDERARRNALYFIAVDEAESDERFWRSGEEVAQEILLKGLTIGPGAVMVEIGCGIGRLLKPLSQVARQVHGVDISPEMLAKAERNMASLRNVRL